MPNGETSELFNARTFDYAKFAKDRYGVDSLMDVPNRADRYSTILPDYIENCYEGMLIERQAKFIETARTPGEVKRRLYTEERSGWYYYYLLQDEDPGIMAEYAYEIVDKPIKGILNRVMWNHPYWAPLLAAQLIATYILPHHPVVMMDLLPNERQSTAEQLQSMFYECVDYSKVCKMDVVNRLTGEDVVNIANYDVLKSLIDEKNPNHRFVITRL
jgi:hypothetical protein